MLTRGENKIRRGGRLVSATAYEIYAAHSIALARIRGHRPEKEDSLVRFVPERSATLSTTSTAPSAWRRVMGMENAPTDLRRLRATWGTH